MRPSKWRNRRPVYRGVTYDSAVEAQRAAQLDLLVKAGKIHRWERGTSEIVLDDRRGNKMRYKPDFLVWENPFDCHAEDVKGVIPPGFRVKAILWGIRFPDIPLRVIDKNGHEIWRLKGRK